MITTSPVPDFITVEELKIHLKKSGTDEDAKLSGFVSAACAAIVERIGQVSVVDAEDVVDRTFRGGRTIIIEERPALAVTSVVADDGTVIPAADPPLVCGYVLTPGSGLLRHTGSWPRQRLTITYTAGRDPLPGNIRLAALELGGHLWRQSQLNNNSAARPASFGDDQVIIPGLAYALPYRVRELLGLGKLPTTEILVG